MQSNTINSFNNALVNSAITIDRKNLLRANNCKDVTEKMAQESSNMHFYIDLRSPYLKSKVSILNPNADVFKSKINVFDVINKPVINIRNLGYTAPIKLVNCNVIDVIPLFFVDNEKNDSVSNMSHFQTPTFSNVNEVFRLNPLAKNFPHLLKAVVLL